MHTHEESCIESSIKGLDLVENWLNNVAISHSDSKGTRERYKAYLQLFCTFVGKTPEQIVEEYEGKTSVTDREIMRKYAQLIQAFASAQYAKGYAPNTISSRVATIKSFFKYNTLPLGYVTVPRMRVVYHNRDITHEEIKLILSASRPRERAYYTIMAQSGLRPETICNLRLKHIKEDLVNSRIPCKIEVLEEIAKGKYHAYFTFIGEEAVKYLKAYLNTGPQLNNEDFLFVKEGTKDQTNPKSLSNMFRLTVQKLKTKGLIETEQKEKNKPRNIRLYNLRKFFRKHSHQAGFELVQFWMGHTVSVGQDDHCRPTDVEFHRKVYAEKAMPFLRLETATPTETEKTITELKKQIEQKDQKLQEIEKRLTKIEPLLDFVSDHPYFEALLKDLEGGRYAKIESEHSMMVAQYPKRVFEELMKRAEAEGKEYIEFTPDQLRKMSLEKEHERKTGSVPV
jgi:integrase